MVIYNEYDDPEPAGTKTYVPGGHAFIIDKEGYLIETGGDYHAGPDCAKCGGGWCRHCHPGIFTEQCPDTSDTLPGMEFD